MTSRWVFAALLFAVACGDPVRSSAIDKLGGEAPGVNPGPLHRPGQPCVVCHDGNGPGNMVFEFGGTVYQKQDGPPVPAVGAIVHFRDTAGLDYRVATNCAGNFFVAAGDYTPTWPVFVKVEYSVTVVVGGASQTIPVIGRMTSPIYNSEGSTVSGLKDRSCAHCHSDPADDTSTGHIYLAPEGTPITFPQVNCR